MAGDAGAEAEEEGEPAARLIHLARHVPQRNAAPRGAAEAVGEGVVVGGEEQQRPGAGHEVLQHRRRDGLRQAASAAPAQLRAGSRDVPQGGLDGAAQGDPPTRPRRCRASMHARQGGSACAARRLG